jgi:hypothetical protein
LLPSLQKRALSLLTDHQHYEELCALVASGQASEVESLEWREHAQRCAECRTLGDDYAQTARTILMSDYKHAPRYDMPAGMTERFIAHARSAGVPLGGNEVGRPPSVPSFRRIPFTAAVAALIALIGLALLFFLWMNEVKRHVADPSNSAIVLGSPVRSSPAADSAEKSMLIQENARINKQLREARSREDLLVTQLKAGREALESAERKTVEFNSQLDVLQTVHAELRRRERDRSNDIARLRAELKISNSERDSDRAVSIVQDDELNRLRDKVGTLGTELEEAQHLKAAANQAKDLIVARNLHIVDVHDANEVGNQQRAFGRIFYTEGKSLVFYAYDLADSRKLNAKINFYVWGEKLGAARPVKSLGIFHTDDANEGRWVLTFDDPRVLAQINSVFVTVEPGKKAVTQPRGKKILAAFLGEKANHP